MCLDSLRLVGRDFEMMEAQLEVTCEVLGVVVVFRTGTESYW